VITGHILSAFDAENQLTVNLHNFKFIKLFQLLLSQLIVALCYHGCRRNWYGKQSLSSVRKRGGVSTAMGRTVQFGAAEFTLHLTGATALFALKRKLTIPYQMIKRVYVDYFDAPKWMLRMPGTSISPLAIYEGSFKYADEWYFLSYEKREPLVNIELEGHDKYKYVIFQMDNPQQVVSELRKRLRDSGKDK
jgi:hypothetical protein